VYFPSVGLQLAGLSLQGKEAARVEEFIQAFGGSHRHIIDYLVEEVLQEQTNEIHDFLFQTAILDRLTAPLCDAVTGRDDSQLMLTQLEQANLFLVPLDERREWYRFHHLFADFLRVQAKMQPQDLAVLHQKAAQWYEANRFMAEAIKHALAAGDTVDAARMITLAAEDTLRHARFVTFFKWLDALPDEFVRADYDVATTKGCALMLAGDLAAAESLAQTAAHSLPADAPPSTRAKVVCLQALLALTYRGRENDHKGAIRQAVEALQLIGNTNPLFRVMLLTHLGESQRLDGDLASAVHTLREAVDLNRRIDNHIMAVIAVSNLAALLFQQGRRREAATLCQQTIDRYVDAHGRPVPPAGVAYVLLAAMHYEANELEQTHHCSLKGLQLYEHMALIAVTWMGKTLLAQLQQAMGETQATLTTIRETCQSITKEIAWRRSALSAKAVEVGLQLKQGDVAAVARWADTMHLSQTDAISYPREPLHLVYVRLLLAQNHPSKAQTLLARLERAAREEGRYGNLIAIHALQALAQQAMGQEDQARGFLREALRLAAPQDYYRSLLDEGPPLARLLFKMRNRLSETIDAAFVDDLVAAFQTELEYPHPLSRTSRPLVEPPTEREQDVLALIVAGLSNREIATELVLAMGTVKKHITNIYGKLGVQRRAQAIARARELDLL
jgi:LuxR family maltose regulon positive regulatory protein